MKIFLIFIGFLTDLGLAVICNQNSSDPLVKLGNATCEGDLCVIGKKMEWASVIYQTCVSGVSMLSSKCDLTFEDSLICYCDTDYCNNQTLLTSSEMEIVPIIECRKVSLSRFAPASCNYCARQLEYKNCNDPTEDWPYPISEPTVTCQTSGLLAPIECYLGENCRNWTYYEWKNNTYLDDFYDGTGECRGHLCFIATDKNEGYFKGCISLNEQGDRKLQLGYSFLRQLHLWVCDTDYCNSNILTALEEAKNSTGRKLLNSSSSQYFAMIFPIFFLSLILQHIYY